MIPSAFKFYKPDNISKAVSLMKDFGEEARVIAGGHSLIPIMKQRLTDIKHLIDLSGIDEIKGINITGDEISIGAMTTQVELINNEELFQKAPIIREASLQIADPQVRNLGTIGGNVANGDPANDMPGLMQLLDATYKLSGTNGSREVKARDFYEGAYFTSREDDEILLSISFESPSGGYAYEKQKRKIGDYATAAAGVIIKVENNKCSSASIALTNLSDTPVYCNKAVDMIVGKEIDNDLLDRVTKTCVDQSDPVADQRGPVEFKKYVAGIVIKKALKRAIERV
ncbi:xanthine dehydrogenase family protein subunit M [Pseudomonadota bacterium]|nr:xanthine dehydrogenase family protein subunit M [Alphaproteobacteria bacterium]MDC1356106.1 xanthine dehydrogenase family protein subunit M [Pseudomonadota bacterium]